MTPPSPDTTDNEDEKDSSRSWYMTFGLYGAVGTQLAITIVACLWAGNWADNRFDTTPWLTLIGLTVGCVGGFYNFIRTVLWQQNKKYDSHNNPH